MKTFISVVTISFVAALSAFALESGGQEQSLLPSEALHEIVKYRIENAKGDAHAFGDPLLARTRKTELSKNEQVALSFVYFLCYMPEESDAIASKQLDGSDLASRLSWLLHDRMLFRAFQKYDDGEALAADFHKKFKPIDDDLVYSAWMAYDDADRYREAKKHDKAVATILDDLKTVPLDRPYQSFDALGTLFGEFQETGKQDVAIKWMKKHRDAMRAWLAKSGYKGAEEKLEASPAPAHRAGIMHFFPFPGGLRDDDPKFSRKQLVLRLAAASIWKFNRWIEAAEKSEKLPMD